MEFKNFMEQEFYSKMEQNNEKPANNPQDALNESTIQNTQNNSSTVTAQNMPSMQNMQNTDSTNSWEKMNQTIDSIRPLAMAYVPMQKWQKPYDPAKAFSHGTIFADLDFPFSGKEMSSR